MNWTFLLFAAIIFYVNYLLLVDTFIFSKRTVWFILINIGLIFLFAWINNLIIESGPPLQLTGFSGHGPGGSGRPLDNNFMRPDHTFLFIRSAGSFIIPVIVSLTLKVLARLKKAETEKKEIQAEQVRSELIHLKQQLHPHFFFNSLNSIYSLVDVSPVKSKEAIHGLAKLVRYLLYNTESEFVLLSQEVDFISQYITLMELRLNPKTRVHFNQEVIPGNQKIAPLLFLPLVENTFKHGISAKESTEITISLSQHYDQVELSTSNSFSPDKQYDHEEKGIGLGNLRKRLELLYPGNYTLVTETYGNIYKTKMLITLSHS